MGHLQMMERCTDLEKDGGVHKSSIKSITLCYLRDEVVTEEETDNKTSQVSPSSFQTY